MTDLPSRTASAREEITLGELAGVTRRRMPFVLGGLGLGVLGAAAAFALRPTRWEAEATLLLQSEVSPGDLLSGLDLPLGLGALAGSGSSLAAEIEAFRARPLVGSVLRELSRPAPAGRCVQVDDLRHQSAWRRLLSEVEGPLELGLEVLEWPFSEEDPKGLVLTFLEGGRVRGKREGWFAGSGEERSFSPGEPFVLLQARLLVRPAAEVEGRSFRVRCPSQARAVAELLEILRVREEPSGSSAMRVRVPDAEALRVTTLINALVKAYLDENQARRRRMAGRPIEFLETELVRVREDLQRAESRLLAFGQESGPLSLPGAAEELVEKLTEVDLERAKRELSMHAVEDVLVRVRSGELSSDDLAALETTEVFTHEQVEPLIELVARRAELVREFTEAHPDVARADAAIAQRSAAIEGVLDSERWKHQEAAASLDALVGDYLGQLGDLPDVQIELIRHKRSVEAFTQIYLFLLGRIEQAKITQASTVPMADVLEWAEVPFEPEAPKWWIFLAMGVALGGGAGLGLGFLREYQQRPVASMRRLEGLLGVECLRLARRIRGPKAEEILRALRALLRSGSEARQTLLVVPVGRRARGTVLAAALARTCAQARERVLLVDADWSAGRLHEEFGRPAAPGFGEWLEDGASAPEDPRELLQGTDQAGLTLLAHGMKRASVPAAALARGRESWREDFDVVLFATPLAEHSAGAYELAGPDTSVVLVCGGVGEEELMRVRRRLAQCGAPLAAAVLQG